MKIDDFIKTYLNIVTENSNANDEIEKTENDGKLDRDTFILKKLKFNKIGRSDNLVYVKKIGKFTIKISKTADEYSVVLEYKYDNEYDPVVSETMTANNIDEIFSILFDGESSEVQDFCEDVEITSENSRALNNVEAALYNLKNTYESVKDAKN